MAKESALTQYFGGNYVLDMSFHPFCGNCPKLLYASVGTASDSQTFQKTAKGDPLSQLKNTPMVSGLWTQIIFPIMLLGRLLQSSASSLPGLATSLILMLVGISLARFYVNSTLKAHVAQKGKKDA